MAQFGRSFVASVRGTLRLVPAAGQSSGNNSGLVDGAKVGPPAKLAGRYEKANSRGGASGVSLAATAF